MGRLPCLFVIGQELCSFVFLPIQSPGGMLDAGIE